MSPGGGEPAFHRHTAEENCRDEQRSCTNCEHDSWVRDGDEHARDDRPDQVFRNPPIVEDAPFDPINSLGVRASDGATPAEPDGRASRTRLGTCQNEARSR